MLNRALAPAFQHTTHLEILKPTIHSLKNGAELHILKGGTQEVMRLELIAPAGKWYEPATGISSFTASQLDKGTRNKNSFEIASVFDAYGAHVEITPGNDFITISVYSLTKRIQEVLSVVVEFLTQPLFPEEELALAKQITLQNIRVNEEKTSYLAGKYFRKAIFGSHPYGSEMEAAHIEGINTNSLRAYHQQQMQQFVAIAAGNITDAISDQLVSILSQLPFKQIASKSINEISLPPAHQYLPKEGSVQSTIRYGMRTINRKHADFFDLLFATHILGGYFGSRLMKNIREEKGLTYGISSAIHPLRQGAFLLVGADVNAENRQLTIDEMNVELQRMRNEPVGKSEMDAAKNHFIGSIQAEVTTAFAHADKYKTILLNELPDDYYQKMIDRIDAMNAADVQKVAAEYLNPELFTAVSVG